MKNETGADLLVINSNTGEVKDKISPNEHYNIISDERFKANQNYKDNFLKIKIRGYFVKLMEDNDYLKRVLKNKKNLMYVVICLKKYIQEETNYLIKEDGTKLKQIDIANELEVSTQMTNEYIKDLKELNIIQVIHTKKGQFFAFNPYIINKSESILKTTADLFDKKELEKLKK